MSDLLTIIGLVALLIGLAASGLMSAEAAGAFLVVLVILLAIGRATDSGPVSTIFRVGISVLSVLALGLHYGGGSAEALVVIIAQVCTIGALLFVIFSIVSKVLRR